ncbi:hypothetical protein [Pseudobacillus wudalianchiensis]|uniref:Uncharacterized protein n=1 Tax=Pseudobacillus wudalianchiensis TaxID=1743143 RepID=A0A1B9AMY0_9BACI|nr:hypothetical protein [Bacillus wudalianchiensis]OCA85283.1 hypothetical protein A8F95_11470 [Bacillus wudalianchiensis]
MPVEEGKLSILKVDNDTKTLFYEYIDRPLTVEEKMDLLLKDNEKIREHQSRIKQELDDLIFGGTA